MRGRGRAHEQLGEFDRARDDLEGLLRRAGDASDSTAECQALLDLGRLWTSRDYGRAGDLFRRGLELARRLDRPSLLAATLNRVGNWHLNSERPNQALALHKEALDLARGVDDLAGVAESLDLLGTVHLTLGDVAAASRSYRDAAGRFRSLGNRRGLASALSMLAFCAPQYLAQPTSWTGIDEAEAVAGSREALELCRSMGWRSGEALCLVGLGTVLGQHGAYGGALEAAERARRLAEEDGHPYWGALSTLILGAIHLDLLNTHQASVHARAAFEQAGGLGSTYWQRTASGFLVGACLLAGDRAGARAVVDEVLPPGTRLDGGATLTAGLRHAWRARAEVALAEGKHVEALEIVGALQDSTVAATGAAPSPAFQLLRGQILVAAGRGGEAQALWREAIAESERCGTLPLSWRLHAALGRALRGQRRLEEADAHLSSAREQVRRLAAAIPDPLLRDAFVRASGRMLPGTSPRRAAKHTYAGLTEREREIASLVASGLTNPQIAAELVLSARTIEKHVENVLRKLGFDSRVQVAAWAVRAGLVVPRREAT